MPRAKSPEPGTRIRSLATLVALLLVGSGLAGDGPSAPAKPFFFIQLSDPQFGFSSANADFAQESANFEFAIAAANRLRPAFVVVTGDLLHQADDPQQAAEYQRIAAKLDRAIPLYNVPGNHDVGAVPTPATLDAYTRRFGPDHYAFSADGFLGIVIDSCLAAAPEKAGELAGAQETWLRAELERARREGVRHVVVFQHHPLFVTDADERDEYFNVPAGPRKRLLDLFRENGVRFVFAGHLHRNAVARAGDVEMVTTGPVGKPLGDGASGLRVVSVTQDGISHRYYHFGELPSRVELPRS